VSKDADIATPVVRGRTEPGGCSLPDAHTRTGEFRQKDNQAMAALGWIPIKKQMGDPWVAHSPSNRSLLAMKGSRTFRLHHHRGHAETDRGAGDQCEKR
jgi:hypothetical protein